MARHRDVPATTPGELAGWGGFATVVAVVLVGTVGSGWGWAAVVGGLGTLVTAALWAVERWGGPLLTGPGPAGPGPADGTGVQGREEGDDPGIRRTDGLDGHDTH